MRDGMDVFVRLPAHPLGVLVLVLEELGRERAAKQLEGEGGGARSNAAPLQRMPCLVGSAA